MTLPQKALTRYKMFFSSTSLGEAVCQIDCTGNGNAITRASREFASRDCLKCIKVIVTQNSVLPIKQLTLLQHSQPAHKTADVGGRILVQEQWEKLFLYLERSRTEGPVPGFAARYVPKDILSFKTGLWNSILLRLEENEPYVGTLLCT